VTIFGTGRTDSIMDGYPVLDKVNTLEDFKQLKTRTARARGADAPL
jgi:hypothetical protein